MPRSRSLQIRFLLILGLISAIALGLRTIPSWNLVFSGERVVFQGTDAWYHMRLVDNLVRNFPHWPTFDPYRAFPNGQSTEVLPLLDYLIATSALLLGGGEPSSRLLDAVGAWLPPILGILCLIFVYFSGCRLQDPLAGLLAAAFLGFFPGFFLLRSRLGFTDHHVLEVLLVSGLFTFLVFSLEQKAARRRRLCLGLEPIPGVQIFELVEE